MRVLDLFSGIGGFSLGLERAGMRTVAFCEIEPYCRAVLAKHWPGVPCFDDIHTLDADRLGGLGPIDIICGGYPCQPFSSAGKRLGKEDHRHLWPQMRRVIASVRPAWVLAENVAGHIAMGLDEVLSDLEGDGYAPRALVIPAAAVDAWHIRSRVWIVARDRDRESACPIDAQMEKLRGDVADTDCQRLQGYWRERELGQREDAQQASRGCRWEPEPDVGRVADGISNRMDRLRALGNAVVPQVVEIIGRAIMRESK